MTTAKKSHWFRTTLIVLVACGIAGVILAAVMFSANPGRTYASATVQFSFKGAADGKAPNGYSFDTGGITSDEVLEEALEASGLTGKITPEQVRKNMKVTGVYPDRIVEQMTQYVSLLDKDAGTQAPVTDYRATQYSVTLYADLDPSLSSGQLTGLLENILTAYRGHFARTYSANLTAPEAEDGMEEYDFTYRVQAISETSSRQSRYAQEMADLAPDFQLNGKGFGDIVLRYTNLKSEIDSVNAEITLNAVSKDPERLKAVYEKEIIGWTNLKESRQEELKQVEKLMNAYEKEGVIYVSSGSAVQKVENNANKTYEKLVARHQELTDEIAELNAKIAKNKEKLEDLNGGAAAKTESGAETAGEEAEAAVPAAKSAEDTEKANASAEKRIQRLKAKQDAITRDFIAMLDAYSGQEINEKTVSVSGLKYQAPSLVSGAFAIRALKTAGPICVVGFMACLVLMIISRWKEEKAKKQRG